MQNMLVKKFLSLELSESKVLKITIVRKLSLLMDILGQLNSLAPVAVIESDLYNRVRQ